MYTQWLKLGELLVDSTTHTDHPARTPPSTSCWWSHQLIILTFFIHHLGIFNFPRVLHLVPLLLLLLLLLYVHISNGSGFIHYATNWSQRKRRESFKMLFTYRHLIEKVCIILTIKSTTTAILMTAHLHAVLSVWVLLFILYLSLIFPPLIYHWPGWLVSLRRCCFCH